MTWTNLDGDRHRVRSRNGPVEFDSGNIERGASWSVTLSAAGTYAYLDDRDRDNTAYHGTIVVAASEGGAGSGSGASTGGGSTGGGSATTAPATATVSIGDRVFGPAFVTIVAGGSVTWRNGDDRDHTATGRATSFDTGILEPGASAREQFPSAGTFSYLCAIHPEMVGTVRVVAAGTASAPPAAAPEPTPRPTAPPSTTGSSSGSSGGVPAAATLRIVDLAFDPATATVPLGTTVTWTNGGAAVHTVTATDRSFDSGLIGAGATWSRTFDQAGTYAFLCAVHPQMTGRLVVSAAATSGGPSPATTTVPPAAVAPAVSGTPSSGANGGSSGQAGTTTAPPAVQAEATPATPAAARSAIDVGAALRATLAIMLSLIGVASFGRLIRGVSRT